MKRSLLCILSVLFVVFICGCIGIGKADKDPIGSSPNEIIKEQFDLEKTNQLLVKIGNNSFVIRLEDNVTTQAIKEWLKTDEKTVSATNYGGFEKILSLGKSFPTNDKQTVTEYGDVMLYSGNQIVIFYEPNSWAYTRIGKVVGDGTDLAAILSGSEREAKISLILK